MHINKSVLCIALALSSVSANAQFSDSKCLLSEIESAYKAAKRPFDLHSDEAFKAKVVQVIKASDENTVKLLNEYAVFVYMNGMMPDVAEAIAKMSPELKGSEEGTKMMAYYYSMRELKEGDIVPDFTLPTHDGKQLNLYGFLKENKCTVIDFWASWCHWCRLENPNLQKTYDSFKDKGLGMISVSFDDKRDKWLKAIEEDQTPWLHVSDLVGINGKNMSEVYRQYDLLGIPAILLVDSDGKVIKLRMRGEEIYRSVDEYLKDK
ncbi:MAG: peroxiredoxin family protein [Prevotella sp.]